METFMDDNVKQWKHIETKAVFKANGEEVAYFKYTFGLGSNPKYVIVDENNTILHTGTKKHINEMWNNLLTEKEEVEANEVL